MSDIVIASPLGVFAEAIQKVIDQKVYEVTVRHIVLASNVGDAIKVAMNEPGKWASSVADVKEIGN